MFALPAADLRGKYYLNSVSQDKDGGSSVLLPISPVQEEPTTPSSKDAFRSVEMPNPDATSWFGEHPDVHASFFLLISGF